MYKTITMFATAAIAFALAAGPAAAQKSTWDEIKSSGKLNMCVVEGHAYFGTEKDGYPGFAAVMGRDLATHLKVEPAYHKVNATTRILDLQAGRCVVIWGLNQTPERWMAVDFAGPMWKFSYMAVTKKGFNPGNNWQDFNKPTITLGAPTGTADALAARKYAPDAQFSALVRQEDATLAVQAGRIDAMIATSLIALDAYKKNPGLGNFIALKPEYGLAAYAAVKKESDTRFREYVQNWSNYNKELGNFEAWIKEQLARDGIKPEDIPPEIQF